MNMQSWGMIKNRARVAELKVVFFILLQRNNYLANGRVIVFKTIYEVMKSFNIRAILIKSFYVANIHAILITSFYVKI